MPLEWSKWSRQCNASPPLQEGDGVSVTAIREIMLLRELKHLNIVNLEAVHVCRKVFLLCGHKAILACHA